MKKTMQNSVYRKGGNNMHFYLLDSEPKFWKGLYKKLITVISCVVGWRVELGNRDLRFLKGCIVLF